MGVAPAVSRKHAYLGCKVRYSKKSAYLRGAARSTKHAYLIGWNVAKPAAQAYDYIWLRTEDGTTKSKKFRVIAQEYDDGTWNRSESVKRQIGGDLDHSLGANYRTWTPQIMVRWDESETNYGSLSDLEYFYKLNNPRGTPSNRIWFVDNHGGTVMVHMVGQMNKQALGCMIQGTEAWYIYRLTLEEENGT